MEQFDTVHLSSLDISNLRRLDVGGLGKPFEGDCRSLITSNLLESFCSLPRF